MDWIRENILFLIASLGGAILSVLTIESHSPREAITRFSAGIFCAMFFTDPAILYFGIENEMAKNGIGGLIAISGYSIAKVFADISYQNLVDIVKIIRGSK